jgi:Fe-S-cluster containining protein
MDARFISSMTKDTKKATPVNSKIEMKISVIRKIASQKNQENWEFRSMLKASDLPQETIDTTAHEVYQKLKEQIDCTSCGHCCKTITPIVSEADLKRIAKFLNISVKSTKQQWITKHPQLGLVFNVLPCPFLKSKKCSIYAARPHDCRSYPHLHKKKILNYFTSIFSHIDMCPFMFHFYEGMKKKLLKKLDPEKTTWL